ncbi:MAG: peroxiredoxin [Actinobacteria bacterium]|nr:peroxiredoxin [Actinomycetota bacterium]
MTIEVGDEAPDFELKSPDNEVVKLSSFRGNKPVLLVFYPFTFTGVCEGELCRIRDDFSQFEAAGVQVLAVSCDSKNAQRVWTEQLGFPYLVLSDFWPHGAAARAFGVFNEALGCANRATFLIDKSGVVVDTFATDNLGTARDPERYTEALAKL